MPNKYAHDMYPNDNNYENYSKIPSFFEVLGFTTRDTCNPEDTTEHFYELHHQLYGSRIWKLWWVPTEKGESRTHLGKLQGSLFATKGNNIKWKWMYKKIINTCNKQFRWYHTVQSES